MPTKRKAGHGAQPVERVVEQVVLVGRDVGHADRLDIVDRGAEPDRVGDVAGAGLELLRRLLVDALLEGDVLDHVAAALPRRHRLELARLAVERADAGRPEHLVAGEDVEVAVERLHVDRHVRDGLRAVDQHARAVAVRHLDHLARRRDRAERIRDLREGDDARAAG